MALKTALSRIRIVRLMRSRTVISASRGLIVSFLVIAQGACGQRGDSRLTAPPFSELLGTRYEVVVDDLYAYGYYGNWPERIVTGVILSPGVGNGLSGRYVAFRRRIPRGTVIQIVEAWDRFIVAETGVYYLVSVSGSDLPRDVPVRIDLYRPENRGGDFTLNPLVYRPLHDSH